MCVCMCVTYFLFQIPDQKIYRTQSAKIVACRNSCQFCMCKNETSWNCC